MSKELSHKIKPIPMPPVKQTALEVRVIKSDNNNQRKPKYKMMNNHKKGCEYNCPSCTFFACRFLGDKERCEKLNCNGDDKYFIKISG